MVMEYFHVCLCDSELYGVAGVMEVSRFWVRWNFLQTFVFVLATQDKTALSLAVQIPHNLRITIEIKM